MAEAKHILDNSYSVEVRIAGALKWGVVAACSTEADAMMVRDRLNEAMHLRFARVVKTNKEIING